ncbi:MAG: hypothetical protein KatS3mg105_3042 [Gemmatales bacterium]|nr:MAG: hypothetical protein KatS3mg105_3042 [Gemmatales bacterium]
MICLLFGFTWASLAADTADVPKDIKPFQGQWQFVSVTAGGDSLDRIFEGADVFVEKNIVTVTLKQGTQLRWRFVIDAQSSPKCVDFIRIDEKGKPLYKEPTEGIYEFKGGELKVCTYVKEGARQRPAEFSSEGGQILFILKRK